MFRTSSGMMLEVATTMTETLAHYRGAYVKFEKTIRDRRKNRSESQAHSFNSHAKDMLQLAGNHPTLLLLGVHVSIPPTALRNSPIKPRRVSPWTYKQTRTKTNEHINSLSLSVCLARMLARSCTCTHTHTHSHMQQNRQAHRNDECFQQYQNHP